MALPPLELKRSLRMIRVLRSVVLLSAVIADSLL
jgi:hypothetical protein